MGRRCGRGGRGGLIQELRWDQVHTRLVSAIVSHLGGNMAPPRMSVSQWRSLGRRLQGGGGGVRGVSPGASVSPSGDQS